MKHFIIYNDDGDILRTGTCQDNDFYLQARDGENIIEGIADDSKQIIQNGGVIEKPPVVKSTEEILNEVRAQRDALLLATDWTQLADIPPATKSAYKTYRKALRDLPAKYDSITDINDVVYPQLGD